MFPRRVVNQISPPRSALFALLWALVTGEAAVCFHVSYYRRHQSDSNNKKTFCNCSKQDVYWDLYLSWWRTLKATARTSVKDNETSDTVLNTRSSYFRSYVTCEAATSADIHAACSTLPSELSPGLLFPCRREGASDDLNLCRWLRNLNLSPCVSHWSQLHSTVERSGCLFRCCCVSEPQEAETQGIVSVSL